MIPHRILVTGSRNYRAMQRIWSVLDEYRGEGIEMIAHGCCPTGADAIAEAFARRYHLPLDPYPAAWGDLNVPNLRIKYRAGRPYNANAGFDRNDRMLREFCPTLVLAFPASVPTSPGTADMIARAERARRAGQQLDVRVITP